MREDFVFSASRQSCTGNTEFISRAPALTSSRDLFLSSAYVFRPTRRTKREQTHTFRRVLRFKPRCGREGRKKKKKKHHEEFHVTAVSSITRSHTRLHVVSLWSSRVKFSSSPPGRYTTKTTSTNVYLRRFIVCNEIKTGKGGGRFIFHQVKSFPVFHRGNRRTGYTSMIWGFTARSVNKVGAEEDRWLCSEAFANRPLTV